MKKVLTFGVFDYFHLGHLKLFENAKKLGDYLIVAVQDGDFILKYKPAAKIFYTTDQRLELINSLKIVDEVVTYENVDETIKKIDFDVFFNDREGIHPVAAADVLDRDDKACHASVFAQRAHAEVICIQRLASVLSDAHEQYVDRAGVRHDLRDDFILCHCAVVIGKIRAHLPRFGKAKR